MDRDCKGDDGGMIDGFKVVSSPIREKKAKRMGFYFFKVHFNALSEL
jgi:hypothetical protein